jgi:A/G-specific adenine glycosylase
MTSAHLFDDPAAGLQPATDAAQLREAALRVAPRFAPALVRWQRSHGRNGLPWQTPGDPYRVWLSEVMLQQTQVATVLGYYARFLERFPDVRALAAAPLDDVLTAWAGLGYYSRARNLHRCAQAVVELHGGRFPGSAAELAQLPGIGPSTAAAIAGFCFNERAAILDGNVKRVLSRVFAFGGDLADKRNERALWQAATELLPGDMTQMPAYTQGVMDLGASLCALRKPVCAACPVESLCQARKLGTPAQFPLKTRRAARSRRENWWLWLERPEAGIWLEQRPATGVWAGLWTLPLYDSEQALVDDLARHANDGAAQIESLPAVEHALTHFQWTLHPRRLRLGQVAPACAEPAPNGRWVARGELSAYALPAPLRKLLG